MSLSDILTDSEPIVGAVSIRRPRPPRLIWPPFRPAERASSEVHSCAVPFWCAARPPLLAISRCFSGDIEAKPRRSFRSPATFRLLIRSFIVRLSWLARHHIGRTAGFGRRILDGGRFGFVRRGFRCFLRWILDVTLSVIVVLHAFTPRCCGFRRLRYQRLCHGSTIRENSGFRAKHC